VKEHSQDTTRVEREVGLGLFLPSVCLVDSPNIWEAPACSVTLGNHFHLSVPSANCLRIEGGRKYKKPSHPTARDGVSMEAFKNVDQPLVAHACNPSYSGGRDQED
jgi:hypothetical protein